MDVINAVFITDVGVCKNCKKNNKVMFKYYSIILCLNCVNYKIFKFREEVMPCDICFEHLHRCIIYRINEVIISRLKLKEESLKVIRASKEIFICENCINNSIENIKIKYGVRCRCGIHCQQNL